MNTIIILFIAVVLIIGIFCATVVCRDIVLEERERKNKQPEKQSVTMPEQNAEPTVTPLAVVQDESTEEIAATEMPETGEDNVAFSANTETLDEKYLAISTELKGYYDEIVRCANTVDGVKRFKNANYEEYKVGKNRLVRLKIKRGVIVCELTISNLQFKNYVSDNKVAVKQAPVVIKVTDEAALSAVKDSISIAVNVIEEEKAYKKEQAKLRRAERRKSQRKDAETPIATE